MLQPLNSQWDRLPKSVQELIYSYDATFYDYMNHHVLKTRPLYTFPSRFEHDLQFYQSVMAQRYRGHMVGEVLRILNLKSISMEEPVFPLVHETKKIVNYHMKLHGIGLRKLVFEYDDQLHWFIALDTQYDTMEPFLKKFLFHPNLQMSVMSVMRFYRRLSHQDYQFILDYSNYSNCLYQNWKQVEKVSLTSFWIYSEQPTWHYNIDEIHIMLFHGKIYLEFVPFYNHTEEDEEVYFTNKLKFNMLIYYLNKCLTSVCVL